MADAFLYHGTVMHKRFAPFIHAFSYRVFYCLFDLDALPALVTRSRIFGYNRFHLYSFYDRDHGARDGTALRPWVEKYLATKGYDDCIGGKIMLLCYPRLLGYVFNPLSVYYCYNRDGVLRAVLHEVKNTFGDQHGYLLPVTMDDRGLIVQNTDKIFHVSPFMPLSGRYDFTLRPPQEDLLVQIKYSDHDQLQLLALLTGKRAPFHDRHLLLNVIRYPAMTVKIIMNIHYQALWLWRKGAKFFRRPTPPPIDVS